MQTHQWTLSGLEITPDRIPCFARLAGAWRIEVDFGFCDSRRNHFGGRGWTEMETVMKFKMEFGRV
jgi:hypothetical protein